MVSMIPVELTADELKLVRSALSAFLADFGHKEHEIVDSIRALLGKIPVSA